MKKNIFIGSYALALSIISAFVVVDGAADEPFITFRYSDALVQIGLACALIMLWLQLAVYLFYGVITHRVAKPWLGLSVWIGIAMFYLSQNPVGYIGDITKFVVERQ